jgi:hypothetical protein
MTLRYVHPSNHEVCEKCGAKAKDAPLSPAGYAQAFYSVLYGLDMDIEYLSQKTELVDMFRYVTQQRSRDWIAYIPGHLEIAPRIMRSP